jgi:hypothetical protein
MMGIRFGAKGKALALVSMAALVIAFSVQPAFSAGDQVNTGKTTEASLTVPTPPSTDIPATPKKSLRSRVKAALQKVNPMRLLRDKEYKIAAAKFPGFCKDWERKLHDREVNNENHIAWQMKDGYETGTYVGYSPVEQCECHQSTDGYSIGRVKYDEFKYYIAGKTPDEAKHAKPKVTDDTATTELFRWDKEKWFY